MQLQFNRMPCPCLQWDCRQIQNQELTQELKLPEGFPDIGRILGCWGQIILRGKEWNGDTAAASGGVMMWVMYAPEDGSDPRCVDTWLPFSLKWDVSGVKGEGSIRVFPLLRYADGRTLSARKMMLRAGVGAMGDILSPAQTDVSKPQEIPEDVELLRKTYPIRIPGESGEKTLTLDEELILPGSGVSVDQLLCYTINPELTEQKTADGRVIFRGSAVLHLIYRCQEGRIHTADLDIPFSQFEDLEKPHGPESTAQGWICITSLETDLLEGNRVRVKCGLVYQYLITDQILLELTEDAYSRCRETEVQTERLCLPAILDSRMENADVTALVPGQEGQVLETVCYPDFPEQNRTDQGIQLKLSGVVHVLSITENGTLQSGSAKWETDCLIPCGEACHLEGIPLNQGKSEILSTAEGLEIRQRIRLATVCTSESGIPMVTGLELGDAMQQNLRRPSLILCRPNGRTLWDMAKQCGSSVKAIQQANTLEGEPVGNPVILIPIA